MVFLKNGTRFDLVNPLHLNKRLPRLLKEYKAARIHWEKIL
ncbi:hypothetical protein DFO73_101836 [Cytobacillus oceanisediminis]|uniref:Uncharacterized protein n=1 Tax=Cytobacillus oceanisediminis TaxID=665099 RepID=A0A2V3A8T2_9BACI|nr:hypothetical protein DFO73_101836 [Cytobacillus oceanisediminis]